MRFSWPSLTSPQKRKTSHEQPGRNDSSQDDIFTAKPTAIFTPEGGRPHTLSIAVPGSIVAKYVFACVGVARWIVFP